MNRRDEMRKKREIRGEIEEKRKNSES